MVACDALRQRVADIDVRTAHVNAELAALRVSTEKNFDKCFKDIHANKITGAKHSELLDWVKTELDKFKEDLHESVDSVDETEVKQWWETDEFKEKVEARLLRLEEETFGESSESTQGESRVDILERNLTELVNEFNDQEKFDSKAITKDIMEKVNKQVKHTEDDIFKKLEKLQNKMNQLDLS